MQPDKPADEASVQALRREVTDLRTQVYLLQQTFAAYGIDVVTLIDLPCGVEVH